MTSDTRRVGLAIFGVGRMGQVHLGSILRMTTAHLKYIVEDNLQLGQEIARKNLVNDEVKVIRSQDDDQVFQDASIEGIIICTPTHLHEGLVRRGLKSAKAVFCEKPLAGSTEIIEACYKDAEKYNKPLLCAFNRRFDPGLCLMKQRLVQGEVGEVQCIKRCNRDNPPPTVEFLKMSGGIFQDQGIHDIDAVCWTIGEYPVSVFTQAHAFRKEIADCDDVDQVIIVMKFPSGCIASIDLSRHAVYGYDQRMEIFGSKGMLEQQNKAPTSIVHHNESGACKNPIEVSFLQRYGEAYELELQHFINVVLGIEKEILVKKEEVIQICQITSACEESYRTGKPIFMSSFQTGAI
ncbi:hypothetical protein BSL78_19235 [Apostichopus japonicus]|uniref:Inositol 2-dehydrogenase n=1 Tax=Stichopus japonicus TaxID=307972 RepID=A0A2G8K7G5_STIJA|nr:hypothetical protein BSL78_19235 [Apostichopus japonicus]